MKTATQLTRDEDFSLHAPSAPIEFSPADEPQDSPPPKSPDNEELGSSSDQGGQSGKWIFRPLICAVIALLGLYLIAQFASVITDTLTLPPNLQWPILTLEAVALLVLAILFIRAVLLYLSVPHFDTISSWTRDHEPEDAQEKLVKLLKGVGDPDKWAKRCKFSPSSDIAGQLRRLTDREFADDDAWWDAYDEFEKKREKRAEAIVGHYSKLIAIKTAASPWKIVDLAAVLYNSTRMIQDVVVLYNRRGLSRARSFKLVCHFTLNIYVSGELGDITSKIGMAAGEKIGEAAVEKLPELLGGEELPEAVASLFNVGSGVAGIFLGKATEGAINALFAWRLGKRAIRDFCPTEPKKQKKDSAPHPQGTVMRGDSTENQSPPP